MDASSDDDDPHGVLSGIFRVEWPKLVARLARIVGDVGLAEELAQDALVAALEEWPAAGVPDNPGAWLMVAAKNRAINRVNRDRLIDRKHAELAGLSDDEHQSSAQAQAQAIEASLDDDIGDDLLRLIFTACHPILPIETRVALTLRVVGGLTTAEIARAFLAPEPTIAQRIVRAKRTLAERGVPFEIPRGDERAERLGAVLGVVYLIFNEGYSATAGDDLIRPALCDEALRLGRVLAEIAPHEPEVHGLVALMELNASRTHARLGPSGEPVLLLEQDRARWDAAAMARGVAALARAEALDGGRGPYVLQAAIGACHAAARHPDETDWARIAALYRELAAVAPSPVVELNRAVALAMADGAAAGLAIVDGLVAEPALARYHLLPSVRGDLLAALGRLDEARADFERAASLAQNARDQAMLRERAAACARGDYVPTTGRTRSTRR